MANDTTRLALLIDAKRWPSSHRKPFELRTRDSKP